MNSTVAGSFRIGVDIGGTFTDVSIVSHLGEVHATKSPSVPSDPARGVIEALRHAAAELEMTLPALLSRTSLFVHGSTIATNTLLERTGAVVGLLGTDGFRDTIEIQRGWREPMGSPCALARSRRAAASPHVRCRADRCRGESGRSA